MKLLGDIVSYYKTFFVSGRFSDTGRQATLKNSYSAEIRHGHWPPAWLKLLEICGLRGITMAGMYY